MKRKHERDRFDFATKASATEGARMLAKATGDKWEVLPNGRVGYKWAVVRMKTVRNLMSGKEIEIPADTPLACDPSSETYWSM